jgi:hypothetical protein
MRLFNRHHKSEAGAAPSEAFDTKKTEEQLSALRPCAKELIAAGDKLEAFFADKAPLANGISGKAVLDFIIRMRSATNLDYRNVVGLLNLCRDPDQGVALGTALSRIVSSNKASDELRSIATDLQRIHAGRVDAGEDAVWDHDFADQTLRLVRVLYPLGTDMQNPDQSNKVTSGIDATRIINIRTNAGVKGDGTAAENLVRILPREGMSKIIHASSPDGTRHFDPIILKEGEAVLIGRELVLHELYGKKLGEGIEVPVAAHLTSGQASRGGIMALRREGKIYLFERGAMHPVSFSWEPGRWTQYTGESRITEHGFEHGQSGIFKVDGADVKLESGAK